MITTNNEAIYQRCRFLRDHAMSKEKRYWHPEKGYNFRMTNLQAALGCAQLERVNEIIENRNRLYQKYAEGLGDCKQIVLNQTLPWATNSYWLIIGRIEGITLENRDKLMVSLKHEGIDSRPFFYPMSDMPYLNHIAANTPVTHTVYQEGINLPTYFDLADNDVSYICSTLKKLVHNLV
jgi:perosamine synthetase